MKSAIAIVIFNRPDHAAKLRECLRGQETRELFIISDGPRADRPGEAERVEACRELFRDWPGVLHLNYADSNMGCRPRIASGLDWVFEHTDRIIILEDDLQPHPRFFTFCDEMLERFAGEEQVMSVCGTKTYQGESGIGDYFFSKYANCWGWATWKRAWAHYDDRFETYAALSLLHRLKERLGSYKRASYWYLRMQQVSSGRISSWFYCWMISGFLKDGLHVYAGSNLIVNHGYGRQSTHTAKREPYMPRQYGPPLRPDLRHPAVAEPFVLADEWIDDNIYSKSLPVRLKWLWRKLWPVPR